MSTIRVHSYVLGNDGMDPLREGLPTYKDYAGDFDAQLHANGSLVVVEYSPNIQAGDGTKKADLVAIFKDWEWVEVLK